MLQKLWQWLQKLWHNFFAYAQKNSRKKVVTSKYNQKASLKTSSSLTSNSPKIQDKDLEFLFNQLLEGVINGWQNSRIEKFFHKLEARVTIDEWLSWLRRYESKLLSTSAPNYQLAARMIILGENTASVNFLNPIADLSYRIGEKLLNRGSNNSLVESLRSHLVSSLSESEGNQSSTSVSGTKSSLGELFFLLQKDRAFAAQTGLKLGLHTTDPGLIIAKLVEINNTSDLNSLAYTTAKSSPASQPPTQPQPPSPPHSLEYWFKLGLQKAQNNDLEGAIAAWDQVLENDSDIPQAWHNRGSALAYLNRLEEAIVSFEQAISLDVNDYQSWNDRGNALYNLQRWEEALISWDRAVSIKPDYYQAWYNRGLALEHLELFPEAIESYEYALEIEPDFKLALNRKQKLRAKFDSEAQS
jgi:tetratricopeptide (TPR) repeat protein